MEKQNWINDLFKEPVICQGPKPTATGENAMVSTRHPAITKTALNVLRDGGNVIDATIAACLIQNVIHPYASCNAGTLDVLYWEASTKKAYYLNANGEFAKNLPPFTPNPYTPMYAAAVPGFMPGIAALYERFGTKPWSYYVQPAIKAAEDGVVMDSLMYARVVGGPSVNFYFPYFPSAREFWWSWHGHIVPPGEKWKKPLMAKTLRRLAEEGPEYFTKGEWAKHFVETANELGWKVTMDDVASYQPRWLEPIRFTFRGHEMLGGPPPNVGGAHTAFFLGVMEEFPLDEMEPYTQSADTLALAARVFHRERQELHEFVLDPLSYRIPLDVILSQEYQRLVARIIRDSEPIVDLADNLRLRSGEIEPPRLGAMGSSQNIIADGEGDWVSVMNTLNGGGVPGTVVEGMPCFGGSNNAVCAGPGRRTVLPINCILVMRDGEPCMALGAPGDPLHSVSTVLLNVFGFGMTPEDASDSPRFRSVINNAGMTQQFMRERFTLEIENRFPKKVLEGLAGKGIAIRFLGNYNYDLGSVMMVYRDENTGELKGATDSRRQGYSEGF